MSQFIHSVPGLGRARLLLSSMRKNSCLAQNSFSLIIPYLTALFTTMLKMHWDQVLLYISKALISWQTRKEKGKKKKKMKQPLLLNNYQS